MGGGKRVTENRRQTGIGKYIIDKISARIIMMNIKCTNNVEMKHNNTYYK